MLQKYHLYNTRLDFDNLVLDSPGFDGAVAAIDRLVIGGAQTTALTTFGGINTGQHGKFPLFLCFQDFIKCHFEKKFIDNYNFIFL